MKTFSPSTHLLCYLVREVLNLSTFEFLTRVKYRKCVENKNNKISNNRIAFYII